MISVIKEFNLEGFNINWVNAISKIGYILINYDSSTNDFGEMWILADKIGQFFRNEKDFPADAVAYHFYECEEHPPRLFVIPRFQGEYEDHNKVYNIAESENQPTTSSKEIIEPLIPRLIEYINK